MRSRTRDTVCWLFDGTRHGGRYNKRGGLSDRGHDPGFAEALDDDSDFNFRLGYGAVSWRWQWPSTPLGVEPGWRTSATAAHRSVAVTGPMKLARTTPA